MDGYQEQQSLLNNESAKSTYGAKNDRPGDDGTLRRVIFGSIVKNHRIIIIIIIIVIFIFIIFIFIFIFITIITIIIILTIDKIQKIAPNPLRSGSKIVLGKGSSAQGDYQNYQNNNQE